MASFVLLFLLYPVFFSYMILYVKKSKDYVFIAFGIYISNLMMNLGNYLIDQKSILNYLSFDSEFFLFYALGSFLSCLFAYELFCFIRHYRGLALYKKTTLVLGLLSSAMFVYFYWLLGDSGRQSFEIFMYNLVTPVNSDVANFDITLSAMLSLIAILWVSFTLCFMRNGIVIPYHRKEEKKRSKFLIATILPSCFLVACFVLPIYTFHLEEAYGYFFVESEFIEENYVDPKTTSITWPAKKRNLIYIFLESFESSFFSKELGGMERENLLPNLSERMHQGTYFSNHDPGLFGGARSMPQTTVTIQGKVASLGGVNYKIPTRYSKDDAIAVVPYLTTLSDLLAEQGYQLNYMIGATVDNYHIGPFFRAHGNTETQGLEEKIAAGKLPEGYHVWWGFEDRKLYDFAKEDLSTLGEQDTPFFYTITTNDTHRTGGYTDPSCPTGKEYNMQNAISCTDIMLDEFLEWLTLQPFYENTTVVMVGDHLAHEEEYSKSLVPKEEHRIFNLILNSQSPYGQEPQYQREFWAADFYPTVVSALGGEIKGERLGLGTNLYSSFPTLLESYGVEYVTNELSEQSFFYTDEFLRP